MTLSVEVTTVLSGVMTLVQLRGAAVMEVKVLVQESTAVVPVGGTLAPVLSTTTTEIVQLALVTFAGAVQETEQLGEPVHWPLLLKVPK